MILNLMVMVLLKVEAVVVVVVVVDDFQLEEEVVGFLILQVEGVLVAVQ
jgi:hypothetical protein